MAALKFSWLEWLPFRPWRIVGLVEAADEIPERLPPKGAVIVGNAAHPKWLAFNCPCRQKHRIIISLDNRIYPHWRSSNAAHLSLWPSIDAWQGKRRCHYLIQNGRTIWVNGRGHQ